MFDDKYMHPLEMFSWQHFVALGVVLTIILTVFFCRKFFMKHPLADKIFRYTLATLLIAFELVLQLHNGLRPLYGRVITDTYPLCGYMIWICAIALYSNSNRLMRLIYPLTITGGMLSLIVIDMTCTFPHFGAFQFWFVHGGFLLGSLYYVFTKKIGRYTISDLGNSFLFLLGLATYVMLVFAGKLQVNSNLTDDPLFIISPPGGLESVKNALGQFGYSVCYILLIVAILFAIYGITFLCTKHRPYGDEKQKPIKEGKFLNYLAKLSLKQKLMSIGIVFGSGVIFSILQKVMKTTLLNVIDIIFLFLLILFVTLNEIVVIYKKEQEELASNNELPKEELLHEEVDKKKVAK